MIIKFITIFFLGCGVGWLLSFRRVRFVPCTVCKTEIDNLNDQLVSAANYAASLQAELDWYRVEADRLKGDL
jgi:hypothetical protein